MCKRWVFVVGLFVGVLLVLAPSSMAQAAGPWEGFEADTTSWRPSDATWSDSNATGVSLSTDFASEGRQSLRLDFEGVATKAAAFIDRDMDMSSVRAVSLDLYNATSAGQVAIAVCTGDAWTWQESRTIPVQRGWNKGITFDLTKSNFKSAATGWTLTGKLQDLNRVRKFVVLFYEGPERKGSVYIDNIEFSSEAPAAAAPLAPVATAGVWEGFEAEATSWRASDPSWGDSSATGVSVSAAYASEGKRSLRLEFAGPGTKACAYVDKYLDLTSARAIAFDLYNATVDGKVAVAFCTGDEWIWQESLTQDVKAGWNRGLTFDMTKWTWKSADTGWAHSGKLHDMDAVRRVVILYFVGTQREGSVYIDNVSFR